MSGREFCFLGLKFFWSVLCCVARASLGSVLVCVGLRCVNVGWRARGGRNVRQGKDGVTLCDEEEASSAASAAALVAGV
jgi:hypothetical protein